MLPARSIVNLLVAALELFFIIVIITIKIMCSSSFDEQ